MEAAATMAAAAAMAAAAMAATAMAATAMAAFFGGHGRALLTPTPTPTPMPTPVARLFDATRADWLGGRSVLCLDIGREVPRSVSHGSPTCEVMSGS